MRFAFIVFLLAANCYNLLAQVNDAGLWLNINVEKKINKRFKVAIAEEIRFRENITMVGQFFTDVSLQYKITKGLLVSGSYRFIMRQNLDFYYEARQRFYADLTYKQGVQKFDFTIRTRVQDQDRYNTSPDETNIQVLYWRNKFSVKYDFKDFNPFVSFEVYYPLNRPKGNVIDGLRYQAGTDYKINKHNAVSVYYLIDQTIQLNNPYHSYVIGVDYNYAF